MSNLPKFVIVTTHLNKNVKFNRYRSSHVIFYKILFFLECRAGYFGENCNSSCGRCLNDEDNSTCHHVNGSCSQGCESGYQEPTCEKGK